MKILFYLPTPGGLTGAPRRLLTLALAMKRAGHHVCIVSDSDSELLRGAEAKGLDTIGVNPLGVLALRGGALFNGGLFFRVRVLLALLSHNIRFCRLVRSWGADVCWTRGSKGIAFVAPGVLASRRPLIWDIDYEPPSIGVVRLLHRFGLWSASRVVLQYSAAAEQIFGTSLARRYQEKCLALIPGLELGALPHRDLTSSRATEGGAGRTFVLLQVGTVCERKNQSLMIKALERLGTGIGKNNIKMQFAGGVFDAEYSERLEEAVSAAGLSGHVEFLGWRNDVHELMARADLLVMPSRDEGVPNAVQEAMAIGLPVMVSRAGGMPEVVEDEVTGWVLDEDDPDAWAERIEWCLENPKRVAEIAEAASRYAVANFTNDAWGARYAAVFVEANDETDKD